jgi:hypothetical protein
MLVTDKRRFIQVPFDSEEEIENVVVENSTDIFGPDSIYFPKTLIKTSGGTGTIPDGFVIDLAERKWFIVEAETSSHGVYEHIARQIAKQIVASKQLETRKKLIELAVKRAQEDPNVRELFAEAKIQPINIRKVLGEILERDPIVGMPIDAVSKELEDWANTVNVKVRLWLVKKYVDINNSKSIIYEIPDDGKPILSTTEEESGVTKAAAKYDVSILDLVDAGLIKAGEKLKMIYGPRKGNKKHYEGTIGKDGSVTVLGKTFSSLSFAAVHAIQNAGSNRKTVNGWTAWRNPDGKYLSELRETFLNKMREFR